MPTKKKPRANVKEERIALMRREVEILGQRIGDRYLLFHDLSLTINSLYQEILASRRFMDAKEATPLLYAQVKKTRAKNEGLGW